MKKTGHVGLDEPFDGLFTQGMVNHETYKAADGSWLNPADLRFSTDGNTRTATHAETGETVTIGAVEKMSKSKKNTVDPTDMIAHYGADTIRWFMLSDSPPERDVEWTEAGVEGAWRFVQRLWRLVDENADNWPRGGSGMPADGPAAALRKATHQALHDVSREIEALAFNRAVARIYKLTNTLSDTLKALSGSTDNADGPAIREAFDILIQLIAPMMPHLAEECWARLGHDSLLAEQPWPLVDTALLVEDTVTIAVQVNEPGLPQNRLRVFRGSPGSLTNTLSDTLKALSGSTDNADGPAIREAFDILIQLIAPMMPHLAEECWARLGHDSLLAEQPWPLVDTALLVEDTVTIAVQVNGKRRDELTISRDTGKEDVEAAALKLDNVKRAIGGHAVKKVIVVPQRIVNIVI